MDSNYYWQKQYANERIQERRHEAEAQRMPKNNSPRGDFFLVRAGKWLFAHIAVVGQNHGRIDSEAKKTNEPRLAE